MRTQQYKRFSLQTHQKNWAQRSPNVCQIELTFKCGLHCTHCYTDCYNKPSLFKKELNTQQIKNILDKIFDLGVIWLCFTGGDPLERPDFLEIYAYAKQKGFICTIFSTGYSMTGKIADYLEKFPPFAIEITINGVTKNTYEKITHVRGSFKKTMQGLEMILKHKLPLKVKTMATKENYAQLTKINKFLEKRQLKFRPSAILHARLNGDKTPCSVRLAPEKIFGIDKKFNTDSFSDDDLAFKKKDRQNSRVFRCAFGGGDGINIDPYGYMFGCCCIRQPRLNFLKSDLSQVRKMLYEIQPRLAAKGFASDSDCRSCSLIDSCLKCPGKAFLEKKDIEAPVEYFCKLAKLEHKLKKNEV